MKIGLVSPYDHAAHGGVREHVVNLAARFRELGHDAQVIAPCSDRNGLDDPNFIPMDRPIEIPSGGSRARVSISVWNSRRTQEFLDGEGFDVLHLHEPFASALTFTALTRCKTVKVGTFHTFGGHRVYQMGLSWLGRPYIKKLDGRIAVSEPALRFISRHYPGDYRIIPNGVNAQDIASASPFERLRDGRPNLLWVGRMDKRKGLRYLLAAYGRLKWEWPELRLIVVGPGSPDTDSYRIMSERNLQDVEFVGPVSAEDKARYYRSADIYCSPATGKESFGIVLLEAMAASCPVVASAIDGYASVITDERDGLLVRPKDDEALAAAIDRLLRDADLRRRLKEEGAKTAASYGWDKVAPRVLDYYRECIAAVRGGSAEE